MSGKAQEERAWGIEPTSEARENIRAEARPILAKLRPESNLNGTIKGNSATLVNSAFQGLQLGLDRRLAGFSL